MGFDDMGASACTPPLTTVGYSMHHFARMAVEEAVRRIEHPDEPGACRTVSTELILRQSVSFRYGETPDLAATQR